MKDIFIQDYEKTKKEILTEYDKSTFTENWQENETWEISFTIVKTKFNELAFDLVDYENSVFFNGQEFIVKQMGVSAEGAAITKTVTATHIYYTMQDGFQYDTITGTRSINQLLAHVFKPDNRGFTWNVVDPNKKFLPVEQENFGNGNYLKLVEEILKDYDAIVIPDNKNLTFFPRSEYGKKTEEQIRYKYNTDSVKFDIDTLNLKTQIKGYGKKKEDDTYYFTPITYTSKQSEKWGIRVQNPVSDDRYTVSGNMLERLKTDLQDYPTITGTVTMKWRVEPNKGDYVAFVYEPLGVNTYIQVVGIKTYPAIPNKPPEITLSNTKKTMTAILANLTKKGVI
ncbi:phage tail protein [Enterococcus faecium]|uniref:phage tail protein n=1 Tax=Enterococcus TaxID=1350 RepID=UPI001105984A|nr:MULTISPECIES: phage tail protein [Enterococcus]MDB7483848.1 phage tail protein [Enterococcus faecium]MDB7489069.1 phage tail protein [Enterococcus faecium]MDB7491493.1 phage tail protein [Enterococcus faecium]MDB7494037.1 phage tail protein [Enterococcus faecium]MDB7496865.1 phage tail protein [Enterococcus faecium]